MHQSTQNYVCVVMTDHQSRAADRPPLQSLGLGWSVAFEQAWGSWRAGNYGVGAALVDPVTDELVAAGRNQVAQSEPEPGLLSGNMTAHAEMNAFASLERFNADGLHLYTTLQPCLMCAASAMQLKVSHVSFASNDEFFGGLDDLWQHHPVTAERSPVQSGPFLGDRIRLAHFARLLPMTFTLEHFSDRSAAVLARSAHPHIARLADELASGEGSELQQLQSADDAVAALWDRLPAD